MVEYCNVGGRKIPFDKTFVGPDMVLHGDVRAVAKVAPYFAQAGIFLSPLAFMPQDFGDKEPHLALGNGSELRGSEDIKKVVKIFAQHYVRN